MARAREERAGGEVGSRKSGRRSRPRLGIAPVARRAARRGGLRGDDRGRVPRRRPRVRAGTHAHREPGPVADRLRDRNLTRAGVRFAASSDDPCAFHEPLLTSARDATRRAASGLVSGADQALAYTDWLAAYTAGAAFAGGQEYERGSLTPGKRADLVVLEGDLDPENPPAVVETWVAGRRAWPAG